MRTPSALPSTTRREFLSGGSRYAILGGLAIYAVGQAVKATRLASDPDCIQLLDCSSCVEFAQCTLDKAARFRRHHRAT